MLLWTLALVGGLALLLLAALRFSDAAEHIGLALGIPRFVLGATVVTVGTTLPELLSSLVSVARGASAIVMGNVVGSNVTNALLVVGATILAARTVRVSLESLRVDLLLLASAIVLLVVSFDGVVGRIEAAFCLAGAVVYVLHVLDTGRKVRTPSGDRRHAIRLGDVATIVVGAALLYVGAELTVAGVIGVARVLRMNEAVVAATIVAFGTSLPELTVAVTSALKGRADTALGNVLGAGVLNSFFVVGASGTVGALRVDPVIVRFGLPVMLGATLLYFFILQDRELSRWEGVLLLLMYVLFIVKVAGLV